MLLHFQIRGRRSCFVTVYVENYDERCCNRNVTGWNNGKVRSILDAVLKRLRRSVRQSTKALVLRTVIS